MKAKLIHLTLALGLMGLLVNPAVAQMPSHDPVAGGATPNAPRIRLAGGSSLVVTENRNAAPQNDLPSSGPELIVTEPLFDFDRVLEGERVEHDFLVANRGAGPLAIHQVRTG